MKNDILTIDLKQIDVQPGKIAFPMYEELKESALQLAENIQSVEVTEENIKVSKQLLASVNKRVKEMEDERISIKKKILAPYESFELLVKEIVTIVKNADAVVREQIRDLEEIEREVKRNEIQDIFEKRIKHYSFGEMFGFEDFLKPQHLNKSVSMKSIETDMVSWLEKIDADLMAMKSLPNADEVLTEYFDTKDLSVAIRIVNERNERKQNLYKQIPPSKYAKRPEYIITLNDDKDLLALELFMKANEIQYKLEKVEN